jgi:hypothetical protein
MLDPLPPSATQALRRLTSGLSRLDWPKVPAALTSSLAWVPAPPSGGRSELIDSLGCVAYERSCVVEDDPGEIVRHAAPLDDRARTQLREQQIARLRHDPVAVAARERRIAIEHAPAGRVLHARFG